MYNVRSIDKWNKIIDGIDYPEPLAQSLKRNYLLCSIKKRSFSRS